MPVRLPNNGGTNPRQIGLGVQVAEIAANHNQGTIEISSSSSDLAIQGDGFFIVEGAEGERLYTRNGIFKLNSDAELVNATGQRLLGYGIDEQFRLQESQLTPLSVPLGTESVAKATENVTFEGSLTPIGDLATVAQVIESVKLGDAQVPRPDAANILISAAPLSNANNITINTGGVGTLWCWDLPVPRRVGGFAPGMSRRQVARSAPPLERVAESIWGTCRRSRAATTRRSISIVRDPMEAISSSSVRLQREARSPTTVLRRYREHR